MTSNGLAVDWPWPTAPVCVVTAAHRGIGRAVAEALLDGGATVLITARTADAAAEAVADLRQHGDAVALPTGLDVTDPEDVAAAADFVRDRYGHVDVLVNNAAAYVDWTETGLHADLDASHRVMEVNLYGVWRVTQAFMPLLTASTHPRVVNIASGAGSHGDDQFGLTARRGSAASYGISKAAQLALTTTLAAELADTSVIVNAVDPGLTATWPGAEGMGARPIGDSVPGVLWAATLPDNAPRGGFFRDREPLPW